MAISVKASQVVDLRGFYGLGDGAIAIGGSGIVLSKIFVDKLF